MPVEGAAFFFAGLSPPFVDRVLRVERVLTFFGVAAPTTFRVFRVAGFASDSVASDTTLRLVALAGGPLERDDPDGPLRGGPPPLGGPPPPLGGSPPPRLGGPAPPLE